MWSFRTGEEKWEIWERRKKAKGRYLVQRLGVVHLVVVHVRMEPDELLVHRGGVRKHPQVVVAVPEQRERGTALGVKLQLLLQHPARRNGGCSVVMTVVMPDLCRWNA